MTCVAVSPDGNCLLAACTDSTLRLLDRAEGQLLAEYTGMAGREVQLAAAGHSVCQLRACARTQATSTRRTRWTAVSRPAAVWSWDPQVRAARAPATRPALPHTHVPRLVWHGAEDGRVLYWDLVEADVVDSFEVRSPLGALRAEARVPARGARPKATRAQTPSVWCAVQAHRDVICSLAMHPQGTCLLTSSVDATIKVWV